MVLLPLAAAFPAVAVRGHSERIGKTGLRQLASLLEPPGRLGVSLLERQLAQHKGRPNRAIVPLLCRSLEQSLPRLPCLVPMLSSTAKSEGAPVIIGELRGKFGRSRRHRLWGLGRR